MLDELLTNRSLIYEDYPYVTSWLSARSQQCCTPQTKDTRAKHNKSKTQKVEQGVPQSAGLSSNVLREELSGPLFNEG
jgi:hypothetical protein